MVFAHTEDNDSNSDRQTTVWPIVGFGLFVTVGVLALACAVLLPEYAVLDDLQTRRDVLAHQVGCDEKLVAYNGRMIRATRDDPVLIARLMIRHGNYRPAGYETVEMESLRSETSVPQRLLREASNPPQPREPPISAQAGLWLTDTTTGGCTILLALAMIVVGVLFFGNRKPASNCSSERANEASSPTSGNHSQLYPVWRRRRARQP